MVSEVGSLSPMPEAVPFFNLLDMTCKHDIRFGILTVDHKENERGSVCFFFCTEWLKKKGN